MTTLTHNPSKIYTRTIVLRGEDVALARKIETRHLGKFIYSRLNQDHRQTYDIETLNNIIEEARSVDFREVALKLDLLTENHMILNAEVIWPDSFSESTSDIVKRVMKDKYNFTLGKVINKIPEHWQKITGCDPIHIINDFEIRALAMQYIEWCFTFGYVKYDYKNEKNRELQ